MNERKFLTVGILTFESSEGWVAAAFWDCPVPFIPAQQRVTCNVFQDRTHNWASRSRQAALSVYFLQIGAIKIMIKISCLQHPENHMLSLLNHRQALGACTCKLTLKNVVINQFPKVAKLFKCYWQYENAKPRNYACTCNLILGLLIDHTLLEASSFATQTWGKKKKAKHTD